MHLQTSIKLAFFGALSLSSSAATIWYTDRGSWLAAQSRPIQTIGFEGIAPFKGEAQTETDPGFMLSGISFTGKLLSEGCSPVSGCYGPTPSNLTYIVDRLDEFGVFLNPTLFQWSTGAVYAGPIILALTNPNSSWTVTFGSTDIGLGSGKHALGWDYRLATVPYDPGIVELSNGETQTYGYTGFLGFISTDNITSVSMTTPFGVSPWGLESGTLNMLMLDNVTFPTEVPEPRFLLAAGLLCLVALQRKSAS